MSIMFSIETILKIFPSYMASKGKADESVLAFTHYVSGTNVST